jgi:hypothetical protein
VAIDWVLASGAAISERSAGRIKGKRGMTGLYVPPAELVP